MSVVLDSLFQCFSRSRLDRHGDTLHLGRQGFVRVHRLYDSRMAASSACVSKFKHASPLINILLAARELLDCYQSLKSHTVFRSDLVTELEG